MRRNCWEKAGIATVTRFAWVVVFAALSGWGRPPQAAAEEETQPGLIAITALSPADEGTVGSLNPLLRVRVAHAGGKPMDITFQSEGSGEWRDIVTYSQVRSGTWQARPRDMNRRGFTYSWRVSASDGETTASKTFRFNCASLIGAKDTVVTHSDCWKYGYVKPGREKGRFFLTTQRGTWAAYDLDRGWYRTYQRLMRRDTWKEGPHFGDGGELGHPFWGFWGGQYHALGTSDLTGNNGFVGVSAPAFEDFGRLHWERDVKDAGTRTQHTHWQEGSTYTFSDDRAWIMAIDYDKGRPEDSRGAVTYWEWTREAGGFGSPVIIGHVTNHTGRVALVRHTRDLCYVFVTEGPHGTLDGRGNHNSTLKYFKSTDAGRSWGALQDTGVPAHAIWSSVSFARYGDNYFVFLSDGNDSFASYTRDLEDWPTKGYYRNPFAKGMWCKPHGTLLHQNALLATVAGNLASNDEQHGIIVVVPELLADIQAPTNALPADGAVLPAGATETELTCIVHGPQTYDVSFYLRKVEPGEIVPIEHASGTFIGEDKLLREGDTARLTVDGLDPGATYEWYAVVRGALLEYYGAEPDTTSDEVWTEVSRFSAAD